jgi:hypothetical protein
MAGRSVDIAPLMMVSAGVSIHERMLSAFKSKRVRILSQNDECGKMAALRWRDQLTKAKAEVDIWLTPMVETIDDEMTKDYDDLHYRLDAEKFASIRSLQDVFNLDLTLFESPELTETAKTQKARKKGLSA